MESRETHFPISPIEMIFILKYDFDEKKVKLDHGQCGQWFLPTKPQ